MTDDPKVTVEGEGFALRADGMILTLKSGARFLFPFVPKNPADRLPVRLLDPKEKP